MTVLANGHLNKTVIFTLILILMGSCTAPSGKEDYLQKFERFVNRVEREHENYNKKDWEWADSRFEKFSSEWYDEFRDDLTLNEKLKVKILGVKYKTLKGTGDVDQSLKKLFKEDVEDIRGKVEEYIENDAEEDLEKLKEGAKEIGDSAVKVLEDIIESIDKKND